LKKTSAKHLQKYEAWDIDMATQKQPQSNSDDTAVKQTSSQKTTQKSLEVDEAFNVLDRVIGFINNCDNKASIVLGGTVAILAIIFSGDGIKKVIDMVSAMLFPQSGSTTSGEVFYLVLLVLSMVLLIIGFVFLVLTITARVKSSGGSVIYFGHIAQRKDAGVYKEDILSTSKEALLEDVLTQIYINP
jgi:hypothetical protein